MARKTVKFNQAGVKGLPNDKPVVYTIKTPSGKPNYVGSAKRGRVQDRIQEHLDARRVPGAKVQIQQVSSIREAQGKERNIIDRQKPKYNKQGK